MHLKGKVKLYLDVVGDIVQNMHKSFKIAC